MKLSAFDNPCAIIRYCVDMVCLTNLAGYERPARALGDVLKKLWDHFNAHPLGSADAFFDFELNVIAMRSDFTKLPNEKSGAPERTRVFDDGQAFLNVLCYAASVPLQPGQDTLLDQWRKSCLQVDPSQLSSAVAAILKPERSVNTLPIYEGIPLCWSKRGWVYLSVVREGALESDFRSVAEQYRKSNFPNAWKSEQRVKRFASRDARERLDNLWSAGIDLGGVLLRDTILGTWLRSSIRNRLYEDFHRTHLSPSRLRNYLSSIKRVPRAQKNGDLIDPTSWKGAMRPFDETRDVSQLQKLPVARIAVATNAPAAVAVLKNLRLRYNLNWKLEVDFINGTLLMKKALAREYDLLVVGDPAFFTSAIGQQYQRSLSISEESCYLIFRKTSDPEHLRRYLFVPASASHVALDSLDVQGSRIEVTPDTLEGRLEQLNRDEGAVVWRSLAVPAFHRGTVGIKPVFDITACCFVRANMEGRDRVLLHSALTSEWRNLAMKSETALDLLLQDVTYVDAFIRAAGIDLRNPPPQRRVMVASR